MKYNIKYRLIDYNSMRAPNAVSQWHGKIIHKQTGIILCTMYYITLMNNDNLVRINYNICLTQHI